MIQIHSTNSNISYNKYENTHIWNNIKAINPEVKQISKEDIFNIRTVRQSPEKLDIK